MGTTFDSIAHGLNEAVVHAKGKKIAVAIYQPEAVDVLALRQSLGMTQEQFAARFGFSVCCQSGIELNIGCDSRVCDAIVKTGNGHEASLTI